MLLPSMFCLPIPLLPIGCFPGSKYLHNIDVLLPVLSLCSVFFVGYACFVRVYSEYNGSDSTAAVVECVGFVRSNSVSCPPTVLLYEVMECLDYIGGVVRSAVVVSAVVAGVAVDAVVLTVVVVSAVVAGVAVDAVV